MKFVAVTVCPTGIAHSEMAAEALEVAAKAKGHEIEVEVQGASGAPPLDLSVIQAADGVIFAADATVRDRDRFAGLPAIEVHTREAIDKGPQLIDRLVAAAAAAPVRVAGAPRPAAAPVAEAKIGRGETVRRWLMTGVSYMLPFVIGGGILIALAFVIGGAVPVTKVTLFQTGSTKLLFWGDLHVSFRVWLGAVFLLIGKTAFSMLVPVLAGFIAYAMADRPGIAPGLVGGLIAVAVGAGFLGGLIAGLLAGWLINQMKKTPLRGTLKRMMPILIYPIVGTLVVSLIMLLVVGRPVASANADLTNWLLGLSGTNEILLGLLVGAMMAFDMGGPVNKVAYFFGITALAAGNYKIMAAVMAAGMTPPLALALATVLRPALYSKEEREAGEAAWVMGASFITEGAIPFAAADPLRVIPSLMVGSAATGALSLVFGATLRAPHGGVWVLGLIGHWPLYLLAIAIGTVVSAVMVNILKSMRKTPAAATVRAADPIAAMGGGSGA